MTIFALSSGPGRAGVSVIRLSGPCAGQAVRQITQKDTLPENRKAQLGWFYDPETNERLDRGLMIWFAGPHSFTGEDVAEFHIHGGQAVVGGFLEALSKVKGLRPAEPGEFTRRAFDNGKMDLTEAEGLADLINAETEAQRKQALRQMEGGLRHLYEGWRETLISSLAWLEADIDFSDEELPDDVSERVLPLVKQLHVELTSHLADNHRGERLRSGFQVVILGAPNVGKSTLLNFLSRRDVAIVSPVAGTTRDVLEVHLDLGGFPVTIVDTAGLRESTDEVEAEGIRRALARGEEADLKIFVCDSLPDSEMGGRTMLLLNKIDLLKDRDSLDLDRIDCLGVWPVSVKSGQGMEVFLQDLETVVAKEMDIAYTPTLSRARHRAALRECDEHLCRFLSNEGAEMELLAEDLRMAARSLGRVTGMVDVEDILGKIFSEFCIGK